MTTNRSITQSKEALLKSYQVRLKDDVKSMLENFEGKQVWKLQLISFQTPRFCFLPLIHLH